MAVKRGTCGSEAAGVAACAAEGCALSGRGWGAAFLLRIILGSSEKEDLAAATSGGCPSTLNICASILPAVFSTRMVTSLPIFKKKLLTKAISPFSVRRMGLPPASRLMMNPLSTVPGGRLATCMVPEVLPEKTCGCCTPVTVCGGRMVISRISAT